MFGKRKQSNASPLPGPLPAPPSPNRPAVQAFIDLLGRSPTEWTFDSFYATHEGGAKIWIGNADLVWARELYVPRAGNVLEKGDPGKETREHKALHRAVFAAKEAVMGQLVDRYIGECATRKVSAERKRAERARRDRFDAASLRLAAERLEAQAEELERRP